MNLSPNNGDADCNVLWSLGLAMSFVLIFLGYKFVLPWFLQRAILIICVFVDISSEGSLLRDPLRLLHFHISK